MSVDQEDEYRILQNVRRRQLGPMQMAELAEKLAALRGIRLGTRGRQKCDTVAHLAEEMGVNLRTLQRSLKDLRELRAHPDLVERVNCGEVSRKDAKRRVRERDNERHRKEARPPKSTSLDGGIDIRFGRFQEALKDVEDESVALVIADGPWSWDEVSRQQYDDLGALAARVLRPGGVLVVYLGAAYFTAPVLALTSHGLEGFCAGTFLHRGENSHVFAIKSNIGSSPILFFSKGKYFPRAVFNNTIRDEGPEKNWHPWQQGLAGFMDHVEAFSEPGDLVIDPFLGGGTAAVAAQRLGRRFIGCDCDPLAVENSIRRLKAEAAMEPSAD